MCFTVPVFRMTDMKKLFRTLFWVTIISRMEIIPLVHGNLRIPMAVAPSDTENDLWKNLQDVLYFISARERSIFTDYNGDWFEYILNFYEDINSAEANFSVRILAIIPNPHEITDFVEIPINVERYRNDTFYMSAFPRIIGFFLADGFRVHLRTQVARIDFNNANQIEVVQEENSKELISVADDILEKMGEPRFYVPPINGW